MNKDWKLKLFQELADEAKCCRICEKMQDKTAVLSELNGSIFPKVLFLAEAPGRQGADRTRRPFWGDRSGDNFQVLLDSIGLAREDIFITNSVMCSPRSETGANRKPSRREISNCSAFLKRQIELIAPKVIATLGTVALDALKIVEPHQLALKTDAAKPVDWNGRKLVPLYHPSPQVVITVRSIAQQLEDFSALKSAIELAEYV
ncbi:MAG: uracil-DNA glycosylase [Acidobacteria bacterium]|nr:uracil-DNA glycosylase [Acidobacteriota bacterium]MBK8149910.1 uracil-DNA glycosylase [Acidobacteriota bacterium]